MNKILKGLSYNFHRNLGFKDRMIRILFAIAISALWYFNVVSGTLAIILLVLALMILGTAASARCSITYMLNQNTMTEREKKILDQKKIKYELTTSES